MSVPVFLYDSAGMPVGSFAAIAIYRITQGTTTINGTSFPTVPPVANAGLAAGGAALGSFLAEKLTLNPKGKLVVRHGAMGETADKKLIRDDPTLTVTLQAAGLGTPTLLPGDCFEEAIGFTAASVPGTPVLMGASRWFLNNDSINYDAGDPTKFTCTFELDRQNSSTTILF